MRPEPRYLLASRGLAAHGRAQDIADRVRRGPSLGIGPIEAVAMVALLILVAYDVFAWARALS